MQACVPQTLRQGRPGVLLGSKTRMPALHAFWALPAVSHCHPHPFVFNLACSLRTASNATVCNTLVENGDAYQAGISSDPAHSLPRGCGRPTPHPSLLVTSPRAGLWPWLVPLCICGSREQLALGNGGWANRWSEGSKMSLQTHHCLCLSPGARSPVCVCPRVWLHP